MFGSFLLGFLIGGAVAFIVMCIFIGGGKDD